MKLSKDHLEVWVGISQIAGTIAVLVSVVYLAVQIDDNTRTLKNQGHYNAMEMAQRPLELMIETEGLAEIVETGYADPSKLSSSDWYRFSMQQLMAFNAWEYLHIANESEAIPVSLWLGADSYYRELIRTQPGLTRFWEEQQHVFAEPFNSYVDQIYEEAMQ